MLLFINDCGCKLDSAKKLSDAILWLSEGKSHKVKTIYMYGEYPAVTIRGRKVHVHRLLAAYEHKYCIPEGLIVHHKNGNKLDNRLKNLEIMCCKIHGRNHNLKGETK